MPSPTSHLARAKSALLLGPPPWMAALCVLPFALWFWWPAWRHTWPYAPIPLDDVYIHFDYARSWAEGSPFAWLPGQGYSSGETAPLYAVLLGVAHALGLRDGPALGAAACVLSASGLIVAAQRVALILPARTGWARTLAPLCVLAFGALAWPLLSNMELGVFTGALFCMLHRAWRATEPPHHGRTRHLRRIAAWCCVLVLLRPEALLLTGFVGLGLGRSAGGDRPLHTVLGVVLPAALVQGAVFTANYLMTGEMQSAGAILKLVTENPGLDPAMRLREVVINLVSTYFGAYAKNVRFAQMTGLLLGGGLLLALLRRHGRGLTLALVMAAAAMAVLVSFNNTARFQGFRYYAPSFLLMAALAMRGLAGLGRRVPWSSLPIMLLLIAGFVPGLQRSRQHFALASKNIREQQITVGERLRDRMPENARVLVGDAGAIPFVAERPAIDALGLGGYARLPFVRAALHGEAATLELIQRLPVHERPTHLALYPSWFPLLTTRFGVPSFEVSLHDNVICGASSKHVYRADWSSLEDERPVSLRGLHVLDELDIADLVSEHAHQARIARAGTVRFAPASAEFRGEPTRFEGCRWLATEDVLQFRPTTAVTGPVRLLILGLGLEAISLSTADGSVHPGQLQGTRAADDFAETTLAFDRAPQGALELHSAAEHPWVLCHLWWVAGAGARGLTPPP